MHSMLHGVFDFETQHTLKALVPFPAIAMSGGTCGAVVGCIAAIGLIYSREGDTYASWAAYLNSISPARKFCRDFVKQFGSVLCGDIMKSKFGKRYDLEDTDQASEWINNGAAEKCGKVILKAVKIASEIIVAR